MFVLFVSCAEARPALVPRAIIRPIPMPGFNVSVFDETTGAPIPQAQASDGGGLINGRAFSAPNIIWAIVGAVIGVPLGVAGVKLWRITTALGGGLSFAFAMWATLVNTISETGLASSQSMSDVLILLITGAAFFVGAIGGAFRLVVPLAMGATCAIGGASIAVRAVILRPGLLVPPGLNQQLAFVNIVIVAVGILCGGLSVVFNQRGSMIFATASVGSFLIALATDLLLNGQKGMSRGLRSVFDMNDNHLADLVGAGYEPPLSSQIIVACSLGLIPIFYLFQHYLFPGPFLQPRARDRTQSIVESTSDEKQSSLPSNLGPTVRNSVLSIFRIPGRSSNPGPTRFSFNLMGGGAFGRRAPTKPANERRGSAAYNYGTGVFALPSEIMRQESRRNAPPVKPASQAPPLRQLQPSEPRNTPIVGVQRPLPGLREESARVYPPAPGFGYGFGPRGVVAGNPGIPNPRVIERAITIPVRPPRPDASFSASARPNPWATGPTIRGPGLPTTPRTSQAAGMTPTRLAPSPGAGFEPASTPRMGIGLGMLRPLSADSIIDAYGGTADSGYRYGGARAGQVGRI